ncbi:hypothetical protein FRB95_002681 [Tulasnella sp. JGI-2019a]|nr:hypothetical protein FRB95_002681 [Tulasnella sp. JGI-2019a]
MQSIFLAKDLPLLMYVQDDVDPVRVANLKALIETYGGAAIDSIQSAQVIIIMDGTSQEGLRLKRNHTMQPGEKMVHAVVDQLWITDSINAGEMLVSNEWGSHLIRAPRSLAIDNVLREHSLALHDQRVSPQPLQAPPVHAPVLPLQQHGPDTGITKEHNQPLHNRPSLQPEATQTTKQPKPSKGKGRQVTPLENDKDDQDSIGRRPDTRSTPTQKPQADGCDKIKNSLAKGRPSPTPPRGAERVTMKTQAQYRYTSAERQWAISHANWAFELEPDTSFGELCSQLSNKVPHHSKSSWDSHLTSNEGYYTRYIPGLKGHLNMRRSKAKTDRDELNEDSDESSDHEVPPSRTGRPPIRMFFVEGEPFSEEDFQAMVRFVSRHPNEAEGDFEISDIDWSRFSHENPGHKENEWRLFYREQRYKIKESIAHVRYIPFAPGQVIVQYSNKLAQIHTAPNLRAGARRGTGASFDDPIIWSSDEENSATRVKMETENIGLAGPSKKRKASDTDGEKDESVSKGAVRL